MDGNLLLLILVVGPMAAGVVSYVIGRFSKSARDFFAMAVTAAVFLILAVFLVIYQGAGDIALVLPDVCGLGLSFRLDGFRSIFAMVAAFMWMMTTIFSRDYLSHSRNRNRYYLFLLITLGATVGVFLSDDLYTTFVFFEMMSLASYVTVVHEEEPDAMYAGGVYLAVAVLGGLVTLMGIFLLYSSTGTLALDELLPAVKAAFPGHEVRFYVSGALILFGFGAKAGMYPLHVWLPMAHPVAPAPASALLSGIITKTGIFGVIVVATRIFLYDGYWGFAMLLLGVVTMLVGGILAVFSVDLKRTLACSSMSQLGFIFVGIGMSGLLGEENALAVRGTILHMFNHSNLKLVLFMAAGVVVMNLHKLNLNDIRGFGRKKPLLTYVFLMGALGIGGVPLFNGYISKTLIHESIVEYIEVLREGGGAVTFALASGTGAAVLFKVIEWLFIITGAMTVAYMTKLFVVLFVEKNRDPEVQAAYDAKKHYCKPATAAVLAVSATILPILGLFPTQTLNKIADMGQGFLFGTSPTEAIHYFSFTNLRGAAYSLLIGALIYFVIIRGWILKREPDGTSVYLNRWPKPLDLLKLLYEPLVMKVLPAVSLFVCRTLDAVPNLVNWLLPRVGHFFSWCLDELPEAVTRILPEIGLFFSRCMDYVLDGFILLTRKTVYSDLKEKSWVPREYITSVMAGMALNAGAKVLNHTVRRRHPITEDYVYVMAERKRIASESNRVSSASVSYSLLLFGIGIIFVVGYIFLS